LHIVRKPINIKSMFNKTLNVVGQVEKFKAILVVNGHSQVEGVKFGDILSRVAILNSIRLLMYLATTFDFE
jgi:hypothetical protein